MLTYHFIGCSIAIRQKRKGYPPSQGQNPIRLGKQKGNHPRTTSATPRATARHAGTVLVINGDAVIIGNVAINDAGATRHAVAGARAQLQRVQRANRRQPVRQRPH
jgi:hypothetical protein